jgi:hypothetical protein
MIMKNGGSPRWGKKAIKMESYIRNMVNFNINCLVGKATLATKTAGSINKLSRLHLVWYNLTGVCSTWVNLLNVAQPTRSLSPPRSGAPGRR